MRNKKKISAMLLAGTMMLSMGATAFAAPPVENASITKDFVMAEGIATPDATFKFTATKETKDAPDAIINDLEFKNKEQGTFANGIMTVEKKSDITFGEFPHAGEYVYTVEETAENEEGVTYSTDRYTLRVYVKNGADDPEIQSMTAEKNTANGTDANKVKEIKFVNTYRKDTALTITNNTTGDLADKTKDFSFTIKITPSATEEHPTSYIGKIGDEEVTVMANTEKTFKLHDGETLSFDSLPAGTRYVVTEAGEEDGYTPSVAVVENGGSPVIRPAEGEADGVSSAAAGETNLAGENRNTVTFTNAYMDVTTTGIIMNNLPFVLVIGVAVLALGALAILKKQRFGRR